SIELIKLFLHCLNHAKSAIASLMFFGSAVLMRVIFGALVFGIMWLIEELLLGEEDLFTPEVPALKNSSYRGPNRRSKSCCDRAIVSTDGETFCSWGVRPELS
nr:hypothetical protein [Tanacetum cinerariifolium]